VPEEKQALVVLVVLVVELVGAKKSEKK